MVKQGIEFRRGNAGGGKSNQTALLKSYKKIKLKNFPNVYYVHFYIYRKLPIFKTKIRKDLNLS